MRASARHGIVGCLGIVAALVPPASRAATFDAVAGRESPDANPGDGSCADAAGLCTFQAAIQEANALAGPDVVTLAPGTHEVLTGAGLLVADDVEIAGAGAGSTTVQGSDFAFMFAADPAVVTIRGLTIRGFGGDRNNNRSALTSTGSLTVEDVLLEDNYAPNGGGAIRVLGGSLVARRCTLSRNAIGLSFTATGHGLLLEAGQALLEDCVIQDNAGSGTESHGLAIGQLGGDLIARGCTVRGMGLNHRPDGIVEMRGGSALYEDLILESTADVLSGGICVVGGRLTARRIAATGVTAGGMAIAVFSVVSPTAELDIADSTFTACGSVLLAWDGVARLTRSSVTNCGTGVWIHECAMTVASYGGRLLVDGCRFERNRSGFGIAVNSSGSLEIARTTFMNNEIRPELGIIRTLGGTTLIEACTLARGTAPWYNVAGVQAYAATSIRSSTISGFSGAGLRVERGRTEVTSCTIAGNFGGGIVHVGVLGVDSSVVIDHVLAGDSVLAGSPDDCEGTIESLGWNLIEAASCVLTGGSGDVLSVDPRLAPLAPGGGPTPTHALQVGSPALDAGAAAACPLPRDQRGILRPQDADGDGLVRCDIGAVEAHDGTTGDTDGDGIPDGLDLCPLVADPLQSDCDGDGDGDACDTGDADGDGRADDSDACPCLFEDFDLDADLDGWGDACDNCPSEPNADQADANGDGLGDACNPIGMCPEPSDLNVDPAAVPLRVEKGAVDELRLTWQDLGGVECEAHRGSIAALARGSYDHVAVGCALPTAELIFDPGPGTSYFLVGARCGGARSTIGCDSFRDPIPPPGRACP